MSESAPVLPMLIVVHGPQKAKSLQRLFNSKDTVVIPFESGEFFPAELRGALIVMDDIAQLGGQRVDRLERWMDEFVRPRLANLDANDGNLAELQIYA